MSEKKCPNCGYFLIDIISWDQPLEICQRCQYENETGKSLYEKNDNQENSKLNTKGKNE